ncbi:hypothetical protein MN116_006254, partial [Schistosoma mekongi]
VKVWFQNRRMKKKKLQSRNHNPVGNSGGMTSSLSENGNDMTGKESVECMLDDGDEEDEDEQIEDYEDDEEEEEDEEEYGEDVEERGETDRNHHLHQQNQQHNRILNNCDNHRRLYSNSNNNINNELNLRGQLKQIALMKQLDKTSDIITDEYDEDSVRSEKFKTEHGFLNLSPDIYASTPSGFLESINEYHNSHPLLTDINSSSGNNTTSDKLYNRMRFNKFSHELLPPFYHNLSCENNLMNSESSVNPVNVNMMNMDRDLLFDPLKESLRNHLADSGQNKFISSHMGWSLVNNNNNNNNNNKKEYDMNLPSLASLPITRTLTESTNYFTRLSTSPKLDLQSEYHSMDSKVSNSLYPIGGLRSNYSTESHPFQQKFECYHNQQQCPNIKQSELYGFLHSVGSSSEASTSLQLTEHNLRSNLLNKSDLSSDNQLGLTKIQSSLLHGNSKCLPEPCSSGNCFQKSLSCNENFNLLSQLNPTVLYDRDESTIDLTTNTNTATNIDTSTSTDIPSPSTISVMNYNSNPLTVNDSEYYMNPVESNQSYAFNIDCSPLSRYTLLPTLAVPSSAGAQLASGWSSVSTSATHKHLSPTPGIYTLHTTIPGTAVSVAVSDNVDPCNESFTNSLDYELSFRKNICHSLQNSTVHPDNFRESDRSDLPYLRQTMNVCNTFSKSSHGSNSLDFCGRNDSFTFPTYTSQNSSPCNMDVNESTNSYSNERDFHFIADRNQEDHSRKQNSSIAYYSFPSSTNLSSLHQLNNVFNQVHHGDFNSVFYSPYLQNSTSFGYSITGHDIPTSIDSYNSNVLNNLTQSMNQSFNQSTNIIPVSSSCNTSTVDTAFSFSNLCDTANINNVTISFPMIPTNTSSLDLSST